MRRYPPQTLLVVLLPLLALASVGVFLMRRGDSPEPPEVAPALSALPQSSNNNAGGSAPRENNAHSSATQSEIPAPAAEDEELPEVGIYRARLSASDHCTATGRRLPYAQTVLAQDRANLYRYCPAGSVPCDSEDQKDNLFKTPLRRRALEKFGRGAFDEATRQLILSRTPLVEVRVLGAPPRKVRVSVLDKGEPFEGCPPVGANPPASD